MRTIQVSSALFGENSHLLPFLCKIAGEESNGGNLYPSCRIAGSELGGEEKSSSPLCRMIGRELGGEDGSSSPVCRIAGRELGDEDDSSFPVSRTTGRESTRTLALLLRIGSPATGEVKPRKMESQRRSNMMTMPDVTNAKKDNY